MPFDVQEFRAQMQLDGARPNIFDVKMTFPGVASQGDGASKTLTFMCRAASLPGSSVAEVPVNYFGRQIKLAGNRVFPDWKITIINDEDFIVRKAFERWLNGLNSHAGNVRDPAFVQGDGGYQVDAYVNQYGKTGEEIIKSYKFVGCFPTDLDEIALDWGSNDTIEEYGVTLAYQWWESNDSDLTTDSTSS